MISNYKYINRSILWIARAWSSVIIAFVLFFLVAHIFGDDEGGSGLSNARDVISFICFPVGTIIGLALAYKWEGLGGLIATIALITGMIIRYSPGSSLELNFILLIFPPGLLYLVYWWRARRQDRHPERMKLH